MGTLKYENLYRWTFYLNDMNVYAYIMGANFVILLLHDREQIKCYKIAKYV